MLLCIVDLGSLDFHVLDDQVQFGFDVIEALECLLGSFDLRRVSSASLP